MPFTDQGKEAQELSSPATSTKPEIMPGGLTILVCCFFVEFFFGAGSRRSKDFVHVGDNRCQKSIVGLHLRNG